MKLSVNNASALLLDINQDIEEYAETTVKQIIEEKDFDFLVYPPNTELTADEKNELNKLDNNEHLKSALKKILADNAAGVVFNLLNLLDGTTDPKIKLADWTGVKLVDTEPDHNTIPFQDMLHDAFFEAYHDWKARHGD